MSAVHLLMAAMLALMEARSSPMCATRLLACCVANGDCATGSGCQQTA